MRGGRYMDYKTKKFLMNSAYRSDDFIRTNKEELEQLNEIKYLLKGMDYSKERVQETCKNASYTEVINQIQDLEQEIIRETGEYLRHKKEIREIIENQVKNKNEKLVLKLRYVLFMKFEKIAEIMDVDISTVYRLRKKALKNIKL